jgi:signal peptidase I
VSGKHAAARKRAIQLRVPRLSNMRHLPRLPGWASSRRATRADTASPAASAIGYTRTPAPASWTQATHRASSPASGTTGRRGWRSVLDVVGLVTIVLTVALLIKSFMVQLFFIPTGSMENTLLVGDRVLVNKLVYHIRPIGRGDIVVFNGAGSWLPPAQPAASGPNLLERVYDDTLGKLFGAFGGLFGVGQGQTFFIKRVIGVPGDRVACCTKHGFMTVNGVALREHSYLMPGDPPSQYHFSVVVPPGRLWVMGDNRTWSADSRSHDCDYSGPGVSCVPYDRTGTIPESAVIGRAFLIAWPLSRAGILPVPQTFDQPGLNGTASPTRRDNARHAAAAGDRGLQARPALSWVPLAGGAAAGGMALLVRPRLRRLRRRRR